MHNDLPSLRMAALAAASLLVGGAAYGQLGFQDPAFVVAPSNSISLCDADPVGDFELNWKAEGTLTGAVTTVSLPVGATYVAGSHADVVTDPAGITSSPSVDGATLTFALGDLPDGATGTISFKLAYDCDVLATFATPRQPRPRR